MTQPLQLNERVCAASRMALKARHHYSLFLLTSSTDGHLSHRPVIREFWEVLRFIQQANLVAAIVEAHSLFQDRKDTINLPRLLREIEEKNGPLHAARDQMARIAPFLNKVAILRNKAIAHRTKLVSYDDVFKRADIKRDEVGALLDAGVALSNELLVAEGFEAEEVSPLPTDAYHRMLEALRSEAS